MQFTSRRWRRGSLAVLAIAMATVAAAGTTPAHGRGAQTTNKGGTTIVLCAPSGTASSVMAQSEKVIAKRVQLGYGLTKARIQLSGDNCVIIILAQKIAWLKWLSQDVSGAGSFGLGEATPNPKTQLTPGTMVRYPHDPITPANQNLAEVQVIVGRPGIKRWTVKLDKRSNGIYVAMDLTSAGSAKFCTFTTKNINGFAPVILDRQVVSDPEIAAGICGGSVLIGFPSAKSLDGPLGARQVIAELRSGMLSVPFRVSSLS